MADTVGKYVNLEIWDDASGSWKSIKANSVVLEFQKPNTQFTAEIQELARLTLKLAFSMEQSAQLIDMFGFSARWILHARSKQIVLALALIVLTLLIGILK